MLDPVCDIHTYFLWLGISTLDCLIILVKALANEDTLLRTHCCRHKCFPICLHGQHLLQTQICVRDTKNVSDFVQKHFVSTTNVSQFAQTKKHHEQQCVRNNVSSFARAFSIYHTSEQRFSRGSDQQILFIGCRRERFLDFRPFVTPNYLPKWR